MVDHRDRHALGHTLFELERSCRAAGDGHIPLPLPSGVVFAAAPGDAHLLRTFTDGGIGQTIDFSTRQRDPSMTKLINSASRCSRIILDGHIIHGQSQVRAHNDRIPDLLPDVVVDRLAVGGEGELERRVFIRRRFDARALGEGHRRRGRGRLVSIVALEADLDLVALCGDCRSDRAARKIDPCIREAKRKLVLDLRILRRQRRGSPLVHDLLENGCTQRVVINGRGIRIRQRDGSALLERDGRIEHRCLGELYCLVCGSGQAHRICFAFRFRIRQSKEVICGKLFLDFESANRAPCIFCFVHEGSLAFAVILPLASAQKRILIFFAHLIKSSHQCPREDLIYFFFGRSLRDNRRTVLQRVATGIRREHGRRERTDLRQKQDRQQARQQTLQFLPRHIVFLLIIHFAAPDTVYVQRTQYAAQILKPN